MGPELAFTTLIAATAVLVATALMAAAAFDRVAIAVDDAPAAGDFDAAGPRNVAIEHINALLPQTQCGQCGYRGCRPYAAAIAHGDAINKCPPGGQATITALAHLLNLPTTALDPSHGAPSPVRTVARIREAECIGCTKCILACPVDAILGAAGKMHTVIASECTGCDLCVQPCPVDCIDMIPLTGSSGTAHPRALPVTGALNRARQTLSSSPAVTTAGKLRGGITPADHRQESLDEAIVAPPLPPRLVMALDQYDGTSALPIVAVGDVVAKGTMIAAATGPLGTHHHAPTSATVAAITDILPTHADGGATLAIVLIPDSRGPGIEPGASHDYRQHAPAALRDSIHRAGIVGLGGGGFPTATKLDTAQPITTLIVNAVECEPYVTADTALLREHSGEVFMGIDILAHVLGDPPRLTIGVAADNAPALASLQAAARVHAAIPVAILALPRRYPAGSEGPLIQLITGREVPRDGRPADIGVLCVNVATVRAVYRAVCRGEPLVSRIITVAGAGCGRPGNYEVLIGTPLGHLLATAGVDAAHCPQPLLGGPMMGERVVDPAMPLGKTSHCVLAPTAAEMPPPPPEQACSRCGFCAQVCPVNLLPQQLLRHARTDDHHALRKHHLFDCIECGACSYVCPSAIPLVPTYRDAKARVDAKLQLQPATARARRRFRHHERRMADVAASKRAQRALREQSLREAKQSLASSPAIEPAVPASARAEAMTPSASATGTGAGDAKAATAATAQLVRAAVDRAATAGDPIRERARRQRALLTAEDRLQHAEAELADSVNTGPPGASRLLSLQARVVTARLQRDDAARKLAALDESGRHP